MSVVSATNAKELHELADRFDCPPLKLTSWHILQDTRQAYSTNPATRLLSGDGADGGPAGPGRAMPPAIVPFTLKGSGMTGPGEDGRLGAADGGGDGASDEEEEFLSVFNDYTQGRRDGSISEDTEQMFPLPEQLPPNAPAADVIKAWAYRLQLVYDMCVPRDEAAPQADDQEPDQQEEDDGRRQAGYEPPQRGREAAFNTDQGLSQSGQGPAAATQVPFSRSNRRDEGADNEASAKQRLIQFYVERNLHDRISSVDNVLASFRRREDELFEALRQKYDDPSSPSYIPPSARTRSAQMEIEAQQEAERLRNNMKTKSSSSKRFGLF
jgi:hypothetical protein